MDARCFYTINMEVYVGTQPPGPYCFSTKTTDLVERMCEPVLGTSKNITMDNWFTSCEIVKRMLEQHKITIVGTIRKNKREIPKETDLVLLLGRKSGFQAADFDEKVYKKIEELVKIKKEKSI